MKLNFKKIASVLASTVMLTSTIGFAAAANYPAPFSSTGGAVVYGAAALKTDVVAAFKVEKSVVGTTTVTTDTTTGENAALFTGSSKINVNDSLNIVRTVLTKSELPTVLARGSFSGNVDVTYDQQIEVGSNPRLTFAKQPTTSDDPAFGFALSTNTANYVYNATVIFNSNPVNFTHADTKNQEITLFGQKFTIGSGTDSTNLILFKSASKMNFDSTGTTSGEVTVDGKKYTLELVTASATTATISVTNEAGVSEQKEVTEGYSKKINGITVAVNTADSNNQKYTASIIAGADKITLTSGSAVAVGDSSTSIDGTLVSIIGGTGATTKLVISVAAKTSDVDALIAGGSLVDPVFGTFKLDFPGISIPENDASTRENITVSNAGTDKMQVKFTNHKGFEKTVQFVKNHTSGGMNLQYDDDGHNFTNIEKKAIRKGDYVVVGNQDEGYLLKLITITNSSTDKVEFQDVFSGATISTSLTDASGTGTMVVGGTSYNIDYFAQGGSSTDDNYNVTIDSPASVAAGSIVAFPTIKTSLGGALVSFYEPQTINFSDVDGGNDTATILTELKIPNGDGYTTTTITCYNVAFSPCTIFNVTNAAGTLLGVLNSTITTTSVNIPVGQFNYVLNATSANSSMTLSMKNAEGAIITQPALVIIEGKDDNTVYNGMIVTFEDGSAATDYIGVNDVSRTWGADATWDEISLASDSKKTKEGDLFGSIALIDASSADQKTATISVPKEQIYAKAYFGASDATITSSSSGGAGALVAVEDSEITSVQDKNLIVVGGSCVNKAAAKILESEDILCGAEFTAKTQVGTGQYIIKTVASPYNAAKIAILVAGFEAVDTQTAVDKLLTDKPSTDVGSSQVYPIVTATTP